ncbi:MAG: hypothetical protein HOV66_12580 [Streptomycetaceae bacterium]|nr:hypothetical protein [Streptomycetaceae bacterium]
MYFRQWPDRNEPGRIYEEGMLLAFLARLGRFATPRPKAVPRRRAVSSRKLPARIGQRRRPR